MNGINKYIVIGHDSKEIYAYDIFKDTRYR